MAAGMEAPSLSAAATEGTQAGLAGALPHRVPLASPGPWPCAHSCATSVGVIWGREQPHLCRAREPRAGEAVLAWRCRRSAKACGLFLMIIC